jgi:hypothetical protein
VWSPRTPFLETSASIKSNITLLVWNIALILKQVEVVVRAEEAGEYGIATSIIEPAVIFV